MREGVLGVPADRRERGRAGRARGEPSSWSPARTVSRSVAPTAATAEGQNTRPITDASCTSDFCSGASVSSRAAMMACRLSGALVDRAAASASPAVRVVRRASARTPPRTAGCPRPARRSARGRRRPVSGARTLSRSRRVSASLRGASETMTELRIPPPHRGSRCSISGLAVHTISMREARRPLEHVLDEARPSGVVGPVQVLDHEHERADRRDRLEEAAPRGEGLRLLDGVRPAGRPGRAAGQAGPEPLALGGSSASPSTQRGELGATAVPASSDSRMPACAFTICPSAQYVTPSP